MERMREREFLKWKIVSFTDLFASPNGNENRIKRKKERKSQFATCKICANPCNIVLYTVPMIVE